MEFWYNTFPELCIPNKRKTKQWRKQHLDWATNSDLWTLEAVRASMHHKMINEDLTLGKLHMDDLQLILNPDGIEAGYIPDRILHYPIINPKLQVLVGEEGKRNFDYRAVVTNPTAISDIEAKKKEAMLELLKQWVLDNSQSEEEAQLQLQSMAKYFKYEYLDYRERRANELLNHYSLELNFRGIFNLGFYDALKHGEETYLCDIVHGEPILEKINPFEIQTYMSGYSNKIEDADVITITLYWSPGKIYDYFFSDKDFIKDSKTFIKRLKDFCYEGVGESDEYDDRFAYVRADGIFDEVPGFTFDPYTRYGLQLDPTVPYDEFGNIRVVRMYWKSRRKIKRVKKYDPETGEENYELYTDEYITNFDEGEEETIYWINEAWEGTKIGKDLYVQMGPRPLQYNRINNPSLCHFGIIGLIYSFNGRKPYSMVDMMKPYNYLYDVVKDRLNKAIANDWGNILDLDMALVPKGWDVEKWMYYAKVNHLRVRDSFREGNQGAATGKIAGALNNASLGVITASSGNYIQQLINLLEFIKLEMADIVGISKQREGLVSNRETVGGVERATLQSSHITEWVFTIHEDLKRRVLNCFLETAKIAAKDKESIKFQYIASDYSLRIMEFDGEEFAENDYGIIVDSSNSIQDLTLKLDMLVLAGLLNQMINFSTAMKIFSTCSFSEKIRMIEQSEEDIQQRLQQAQLQQQLALQQLQQMLMQLMQMQLQFQDLINLRDNETKILVAEINGLAEAERFAMMNGDTYALNELSKQELMEKMRLFDAKLLADNERFMHQKEIDLANLDLKKEKIKSDAELKLKQINNQNKKLNK